MGAANALGMAPRKRKVRNLRCELSKLSRATNVARDWDTLVSRARASLGTQDFARVQPWLEQCQEASRLPVVRTLKSERWPDVRPDMEPQVGDYVVAGNGDRATLKKLVRDGDELYLKPLNEHYPTKPLGDDRIIGVVREAHRKYR